MNIAKLQNLSHPPLMLLLSFKSLLLFWTKGKGLNSSAYVLFWQNTRMKQLEKEELVWAHRFRISSVHSGEGTVRGTVLFCSRHNGKNICQLFLTTCLIRKQESICDLQKSSPSDLLLPATLNDKIWSWSNSV